MKILSAGTSDFKQLISDGCCYIDKTIIIKDIINDFNRVILLPRPRRFGKTLNMTTLKYFFENTSKKEENRTLFSGLAIEKEPEFEKYFGKYTVVFLSFKDIKEPNWEVAISALNLIIGNLFSKFDYLSKNLSSNELQIFNQLSSGNAEYSILCNSLNFLINKISEYNNNEKVILLIDEYDTPIHAALSRGYYTEMIDFMRSFLGTTLKDNNNLQKAVLTGIMRVAKESIFSGINNIGVYTLLSEKFASYFGFTENEVEEIVKMYNLNEHLDGIRDWYNGYLFGKEIIYNPWSIINYVNLYFDGFKPYWINTASHELIKDLIINGPENVKQEFELLLKNIPIRKAINENITFTELKTNQNSLYSFLVFSGYLKATEKEQINDEFYYNLLIPNTEVKLSFRQIFMNWFQESYDNDKIRYLLKSVTTGDVKTFEKLLSYFIVNTLSYFDTAGKNVEKVYQAFILGLLVNLSNEYEVSSNRESGFGRYDVCILPKEITKKAIIMELKTIDEFDEETKDSSLENALKQIEEKQYETQVCRRGYTDILKLGVVFDGKRCWIKEAK